MSSFFISTLLAAPFALLLDYLIGEPNKFHPLISFGKYANWLENVFNNNNASDTHNISNNISKNKRYQFHSGLNAWLIAVLPIVVLICVIQSFAPPLVSFVFSIFFGWLAIGWNSLEEHGLAVSDAFDEENLDHARLRTSYLVSRDTSELDENALSKATIESILENGSDAIIAAVFWLCILGAPGVVLYRLSNTLDAMWGYRNERFEYFGKSTARIDDVLNYIPARLCALLYSICGNTNKAMTAWKAQAKNWYSPNAGVVMASGAGALNLQLGGSAVYHGSLKERPILGGGDVVVQASDIKRSLRLLNNSVYLLAIFLVISVLLLVSLK